MKRNKVKEYMLSNDGLEELIEREEVLPKTEIKDDEAIIKSKDFEKTYLAENPFLYDDGKAINSIEDFYILRKNKYYRLGNLLRDKSIRRGLARKMILASFKEWKEDVNKKIENIGLIKENNFKEEKREKKSFGLLMYIFTIISLVLNILIMNGKISFLAKPNNKIIVFVFTIIMFSLVAIFLLSSLLNKSINKNRRYVNRSKREANILIDKYTDEFNKKYKETYSYYCKHVSRKLKDLPLPIYKTAVGNKGLKEIEEYINNGSKVISDGEKGNKAKKLLAKLLKCINILIFAFTIGYIIYDVIIFFINK